jgi:hypothetical protein
MNNIFAQHLWKFVLVFFDYILIYSKNLQQHRAHLNSVLQILRLHQLKAKLSKCTFAVPSVEYLCHVLSGNGVATDPSKIQEIISWQAPETVKQLRGFLGLTGYYRRFVKGYASICRPLHDVLKKNSFAWASPQQAAFEALKLAMTTPPVLILPNFQLPFTLETDASGSGLGAVLMQNKQPIAFFSKVLGPKAQAQSIYEKEGMAILEALKKWRHYLLGNKLIIKTDQRSLKYLSSQRLLEGIQHKLMLKLLEYDYSIEYKQGKENVVADALSRKHMSTGTDTCTAISAAVPTWMKDVEQSYTSDERCQQLLQELAIKPDSLPHFNLHSGVLRYKNKVVIGTSTDLKNRIFESFHSSAFGGHSGSRVTLHRLKQIFY